LDFIEKYFYDFHFVLTPIPSFRRGEKSSPQGEELGEVLSIEVIY
jgi:hypothetical protein